MLERVSECSLDLSAPAVQWGYQARNQHALAKRQALRRKCPTCPVGLHRTAEQVFICTGEYSVAADCLRVALETFLQHVGENHDQTKACKESLATEVECM